MLYPSNFSPRVRRQGGVARRRDSTNTWKESLYISYFLVATIQRLDAAPQHILGIQQMSHIALQRRRARVHSCDIFTMGCYVYLNHSHKVLRRETPRWRRTLKQEIRQPGATLHLLVRRQNLKFICLSRNISNKSGNMQVTQVKRWKANKAKKAEFFNSSKD